MTERLLSKHGKYLRKYHSQEGAYNENGDRPKWGFQECLDNVESSCSQVSAIPQWVAMWICSLLFSLMHGVVWWDCFLFLLFAYFDIIGYKIQGL